MEPNPYDAPRPIIGADSHSDARGGARYKEVLRRGRESRVRTACILIYGLFVVNVCAVTLATRCLVFATEWDRETGSYVIDGLIGVVVAICLTGCAVVITIRFFFSLSWLARFCGFGTILVLLTGLLLSGALNGK